MTTETQPTPQRSEAAPPVASDLPTRGEPAPAVAAEPTPEGTLLFCSSCGRRHRYVLAEPEPEAAPPTRGDPAPTVAYHALPTCKWCRTPRSLRRVAA